MSPDSAVDRYRRRRRAPILIVMLVLAIGGGVAWFQVLKPVAAASTSCNAPGPAPTTAASTPSTTSSPATARSTAKSTARTTPTTPTTTSIITSLGSFANVGTLSGVRPADPATITVHVYNASGAKGLAKTVTNDLRTAGFTSIAAGQNDPLYPAQDLVCAAEIRYGQAGLAGARTLLLVAPCAQLVQDNRISDSVDLALGNLYNYQAIPAAVTAELKTIHDAVIPPAVIEGQTAAARPPAPIPPLPSATCT